MSQLSVKELQAIMLYHPEKEIRGRAEEILTDMLRASDTDEGMKREIALLLQKHHASQGRFDKVHEIIFDPSLPQSVSSDLEIQELMLNERNPDTHPAIKNQAREQLAERAQECAERLPAREANQKYAQVIKLFNQRKGPEENPRKPKKIS